MAIWDKIIKRIVDPVVTDAINQINQTPDPQQSEDWLSKASLVYALPRGAGEIVNKDLPSNVSFDTLRSFATYYPILRACINYRKRQVAQLDWDIAPIEVVLDKTKKEQFKKDGDTIKDFLKYPTGDKTVSFRTFTSKVLEDLLVLDAVAVYRRLTRKKTLYGFLPVDASTIELVLNEDGTTPTPPEDAYVQKVNGQEIARLSSDELIYRVMNPRTHTPYGLSPVETLILIVTTALKLTKYNLSYLTEGNVPEGLVELPKDIASNPDQLRLWQEAWDAMFSGDARYQRKIKFLPEGMKYTPTKKADEMQFERFEKWLLMCTCAVMEVSPNSIGFDFDRGKGAAETQWEIGKERGLIPTAAFLKEIFDQIIQDDLKQKELQFVWTNINPTNQKEEAEVFSKLVGTGAISVDEWRVAEGYEPIGLSHYLITPVGPILVKDLIESSEAGTPILPMGYTQGGEATPGTKPSVVPDKGKKPKSSETPPAKKADISSVADKIKEGVHSEVVEELKRWRKAATNDFKESRDFREFKTDLIDTRTQSVIKQGLKMVKTKEELDQLFNPFINEENLTLSAMLDLYDEVSKLVRDGSTTTKADSAGA